MLIQGFFVVLDLCSGKILKDNHGSFPLSEGARKFAFFPFCLVGSPQKGKRQKGRRIPIVLPGSPGNWEHMQVFVQASALLPFRGFGGRRGEREEAQEGEEGKEGQGRWQYALSLPGSLFQVALSAFRRPIRVGSKCGFPSPLAPICPCLTFPISWNVIFCGSPQLSFHAPLGFPCGFLPGTKCPHFRSGRRGTRKPNKLQTIMTRLLLQQPSLPL